MIHCAKINQIKMVLARGYEVPEAEMQLLANQDDEDYFSNYIDELMGMNQGMTTYGVMTNKYEAIDQLSQDKNILVYYLTKGNSNLKQVPVEAVRDFIELARETGVTNTMLIHDAPLSSTCNSELSALTEIKWEKFKINDLTCNITEHVHAQRYEIIQDNGQFLKDARLQPTGLNLMLRDDSVTKYYALSKNTIVRIIRDNSNINLLSEKSVNYRVVI